MLCKGSSLVGSEVGDGLLYGRDQREQYERTNNANDATSLV
jgi:hypothetical protein